MKALRNLPSSCVAKSSELISGRSGGSVELKWMGDQSPGASKRGNVKVVGPKKGAFFRRFSWGGFFEGGYPVQTQNVRS